MWEKIKAFFSKKAVKIVEWIVLGLTAVGLIVGGVKLDDINANIVLVAGVVDAVALVATFISKHS